MHYFCFLQESNNSKSEIPGEGIANVQLQLYDIKQDHQYSHHNMGISTDLRDLHNGSAGKIEPSEHQEVLNRRVSQNI